MIVESLWVISEHKNKNTTFTFKDNKMLSGLILDFISDGCLTIDRMPIRERAIKFYVFEKTLYERKGIKKWKEH